MKRLILLTLLLLWGCGEFEPGSAVFKVCAGIADDPCARAQCICDATRHTGRGFHAAWLCFEPVKREEYQSDT